MGEEPKTQQQTSATSYASSTSPSDANQNKLEVKSQVIPNLKGSCSVANSK